MKRRTISTEVEVSGIGLACRRPVSVLLRPARAGQGIVFNDAVPATVGHATVLEHCTCLGRGAHRVRQVEHLLAACAGLNITDLGVDVGGGELPFGDGSSRLFCRAIEGAGIVEHDLGIEPLPVGECVVRRGDSVIHVRPGKTLSITCTGWAPGYGDFGVRLRITDRTFLPAVALARTFGPLRGSVGSLRRSLRLNFRLRRKNGWVYPRTERMPQEPGRHKVLDLLGDLWLLGRPLRARIIARRPNHRLNIALARRLEVT